ncbi:MAG: hypothetical protein HPM95_20155 [Alphaproteobacteria bacterium]|nr:hypothetical protein [Alphaproteobacteria bacterium]
MDLVLPTRRRSFWRKRRGLGRAIAETLAAEGAHVIAAARNADTIRDWRRSAKWQGRGHLRSTSPTLRRWTRRSTAFWRRRWSTCWSTTSAARPGTAQAAKRGDWIAQFEGMAANLFHITGRLLPKMQERGFGRSPSPRRAGTADPEPCALNGIRAAVVAGRRRSPTRSPRTA